MEKETFFKYLSKIGARCPVCTSDNLGTFVETIYGDDGEIIESDKTTQYYIPTAEELGGESVSPNMGGYSSLAIPSYFGICGNCGYLLPFNQDMVERRVKELKLETIKDD